MASNPRNQRHALGDVVRACGLVASEIIMSTALPLT